MDKWVDNRLEHWRYILSINDPEHLNDTVIKAMAHADQVPYEQRWYAKYKNADEVEKAIMNGSFFKPDELVDDSVREDVIEEFVAELVRFVVRNDIQVDDNFFIIDYEMIYILVMRDMSYITSLQIDMKGMEAIDIIKSAYSDWYSTYLVHPWGMYETDYCAIKKCIEHLQQDKVKLVFSMDDVFDMKELESLEGGLEV